MSSTAMRATQWIGFVGDLLRQPLTQMPHEAIVDLIRDTFEVTAASYNWAEPTAARASSSTPSTRSSRWPRSSSPGSAVSSSAGTP